VDEAIADAARAVRADDEWLPALRSAGRERDAATVDLYGLLHRAARSELRRRAARTGLVAGEVDDLARQAAADATVAVLAKLDTFRAQSRFTTWAYAFAVFEVSAAVAGHLRATRGVRLDVADWEALPDRWGAGPGDEVHARDLLALLRRTVEEQLTPRQRQVFVAIAVEGVPLDVLAVELASNRNAIYKTMFDARRKIRDVLAAHGYIGESRGTGTDGRPT
jgi:RNA polymerase sigma-70 factor (ECF subfamily)